jgi:hypothetical protein
MFSKLAYSVFEQSIKDYHQFDNVDQPITTFSQRSITKIKKLTDNEAAQ